MADGVILHYLNGSQVEEPFGWREFTEEFDRDVRERLISIKYAARLDFHGQGYQILNDLFLADGYCSSIAYEAKQECGGVLMTCIKGEIIIADCEFNETRCAVTIDVADDGIGARVFNNREIPISPTAENTKNGGALFPLIPIALEVFNPIDGLYYVPTRRAWDWYDAIKQAILYITDNAVSATSAWYEALPDDERYCFLDGNELRLALGDNPRLTYDFKTLFNELAIKYNLWIYAGRDVDGNPVLRIEPEDTFFGTVNGADIADIQDLVRSVDLDRAYAKVVVGSDTFIKVIQSGTFALPFLVLRGHTKEEFHFDGQCNTSETLDLVNEWVIDTNVIEDVLVNGNDDYDDDMFLIQYDASTSQAVQSDFLTPGNLPELYNDKLQNFHVIDRYDLPSPVGAFYSTVDASFRAERVSATNTPVTEGGLAGGILAPIRLQFDNDYTAPNFDTTNNWGNGTAQGSPVSQVNSLYTAPTQGYYQFFILAYWRLISNNPLLLFPFGPQYKKVVFGISLRHFNASNVELGTPTTSIGPFEYQPGVKTQFLYVGRSMDVGDYVLVDYTFAHTTYDQIPGYTAGSGTAGATFTLIAGSRIQSTFVVGGGYLAGGEVSRILKYTFDRYIDLSQWLALTAAPENTVTIGGGPAATIPTHILNAKRTISDGATQWEVIKRP